MAINRVNAVHIGYGKDQLGFRCEVLEDPATGARMLAYSPEDWWERERHIKVLESLGKLVPATSPDTTPVEVP